MWKVGKIVPKVCPSRPVLTKEETLHGRRQTGSTSHMSLVTEGTTSRLEHTDARMILNNEVGIFSN
jgi:hypothetical protein